MALWGKGSKGKGLYEEDRVMNPNLQTLINAPSNAANKNQLYLFMKKYCNVFDILKKKTRIYKTVANSS